MKNNNIILLNKIINKTEQNIIKWNLSKFSREYYIWAGFEYITKYKKIYFKFEIYNDQYNIFVYLLDDSKRIKTFLTKIDPYFFNFKTNSLLKKLEKTIYITNGYKSKK